MTLRMARCIGRADCSNKPTGGRGLCHTCYAHHWNKGTLANFPTMRERTEELSRKGLVPRTANARVTKSTPTSHTFAVRSYQSRRRDERIQVNGVWVHPMARHGHLTSYNAFACRGEMCRESHRYYRRTGDTALPEARRRNFTWEDCLDYKVGTL